MRKEIEKRLIDFSITIMHFCRLLGDDFITNHLIDQALRSSSSAALNYGEAQAAESKRDFIHKLSIVLKELRETQINLRILIGSSLKEIDPIGRQAHEECDQLVAIFYRMIQTARRNQGQITK